MYTHTHIYIYICIHTHTHIYIYNTAILTPTNGHAYTKIRLYIQQTATCFGQIRDHHQRCKIESLDTLIVKNAIIKL